MHRRNIFLLILLLVIIPLVVNCELGRKEYPSSQDHGFRIMPLIRHYFSNDEIVFTFGLKKAKAKPGRYVIIMTVMALLTNEELTHKDSFDVSEEDRGSMPFFFSWPKNKRITLGQRGDKYIFSIKLLYKETDEYWILAHSKQLTRR